MDNSAEIFCAPDFREIFGYHQVRSSAYGAREIPYRKVVGPQEVGIFLIPGFGGNVWEIKPTFFAKKSLETNNKFLTFTYSDLEGSGRLATNCRLTKWIDDTKIMFALTDGPQIIVVSSFGATAAFHLALEYPERVTGIVFVAPGTDLEKHMVSTLLEQGKNREKYGKLEYFLHPASSDTGTRNGKLVKVQQSIILEAQLEEVRRRREVVENGGKIKISCPTIFLHSKDDVHIPISATEQTMAMIESPIRPVLVRVTGAGHFHEERQSDLERIWYHTEKLLAAASGAKLGHRAL